MRNERGFICLAMAVVVEVLICCMIFLIVSMVGSLILGGLFFVFDWLFLAKLAMDEEREQAQRTREWERKNADEEETK